MTNQERIERSTKRFTFTGQPLEEWPNWMLFHNYATDGNSLIVIHTLDAQIEVRLGDTVNRTAGGIITVTPSNILQFRERPTTLLEETFSSDEICVTTMTLQVQPHTLSVERLLDAERSAPDVDPYRLYAIVRGDLDMSPGKLSAQAGHAYLNCYLNALRDLPDAAAAYQAAGLGTKVCLVASSEFRLLRAYEDAQRAGLPCALIIDQHHVLPPHFDGSPIITALGLGPARRDDVRAITKRFSLLK